MGAVFIALGAYLTTVGYRQKGDEFVKDIVGAKGFVLWGVALGILYLVYENKLTRPLAVPFGGVTLIALLLKAEPNIASQSKQLFGDLTAKTKQPANQAMQ